MNTFQGGRDERDNAVAVGYRFASNDTGVFFSPVVATRGHVFSVSVE